MTFIIPLAPELIPPIAEMIQMQQAWHHVFDPRLPVQAEQEIDSSLQMQIGSGLVALSDREEICGYGYPHIWQVPQKDLLSDMLVEHVGVVSQLTLHPQRETGEATEALLFALCEMWKAQKSDADQICWPVCDTNRLEPTLLSQGFQLDKIGVYAPSASLFTHQDFCPPQFMIRPARRQEAEAILDLCGEERNYLGMYSPFVRQQDENPLAMLDQLARVLGGAQQEGDRSVLVAECDGQIVGMICFHVCSTPHVQLELLPPSRYGSLDLLGVKAEFWEVGVSRYLVQRAITHLVRHSPDGLVHCYLAFDPTAPSFWRRQGFVPLWKSYMRLSAHTNEGEEPCLFPTLPTSPIENTPVPILCRIDPTWRK